MAKKKHDAKGAPRGLPTAGGGISRFAYDRAARTGLDIKGLLARAGLNAGQIADPQTRIAVPSQIRFLNLVADALQDEFLGLHLAERYDLRETGLSVLRRGLVGDARRSAAAAGAIQYARQ